jgi:transposase
MRIVYLPPYSPDFNPIEEAFSAIKAWIRRHHDYARREMMGEVTCDPYQLLWNAVFNTVTPEKAHGWFTHSGYLS